MAGRQGTAGGLSPGVFFFPPFMRKLLLPLLAVSVSLRLLAGTPSSSRRLGTKDGAVAA